MNLDKLPADMITADLKTNRGTFLRKVKTLEGTIFIEYSATVSRLYKEQWICRGTKNLRQLMVVQ